MITKGEAFVGDLIEVSPDIGFDGCMFQDCKFSGYGGLFAHCMFVWNDQLDAIESTTGTLSRCHIRKCQTLTKDVGWRY